MKIDCCFEVLLVSKSPRGVLHPLDLSVNRLTCRIGDTVLQIRQNISESSFQGTGYFDNRLQAAVRRPVVPPSPISPAELGRDSDDFLN